MNPLATVKSMPSGIGVTRSAGSAISSTNPPNTVEPITRSPGLNLVTPSPTSFTTPATSPPGENGGSGLNWYLPWMISVSGKLTPAAFTLMTTSPGFATGEGTSSTTNDDGGPYSLHRTALMGAQLSAIERATTRRVDRAWSHGWTFCSETQSRFA